MQLSYSWSSVANLCVLVIMSNNTSLVLADRISEFCIRTISLRFLPFPCLWGSWTRIGRRYLVSDILWGPLFVHSKFHACACPVSTYYRYCSGVDCGEKCKSASAQNSQYGTYLLKKIFNIYSPASNIVSRKVDPSVAQMSVANRDTGTSEYIVQCGAVGMRVKWGKDTLHSSTSSRLV